MGVVRSSFHNTLRYLTLIEGAPSWQHSGLRKCLAGQQKIDVSPSHIIHTAIPQIPVTTQKPTFNCGCDLNRDSNKAPCLLQAPWHHAGASPLSLPRDQLRALSCRSSRKIGQMELDRLVSGASLVIGRQRPQTASGVIFVTIEDELCGGLERPGRTSTARAVAI